MWCLLCGCLQLPSTWEMKMINIQKQQQLQCLIIIIIIYSFILFFNSVFHIIKCHWVQYSRNLYCIDFLTTWMAFYLLPKPSSSKGDNIAALLFPHRLSQNPLATKPIYSIDTFKNLIMHSNRYQSSLYRLLVLSLLLYTSTVYINTRIY